MTEICIVGAQGVKEKIFRGGNGPFLLNSGGAIFILRG